MDVNGDIRQSSPAEIDPGLAAAALVVFAHRHEVVHLLYAAADEADAVLRIARLLELDETIVDRVLDQPMRWMLPQFRDELDSLTAQPVMLAEPVMLAAD
jgi:hypothetical protein